MGIHAYVYMSMLVPLSYVSVSPVTSAYTRTPYLGQYFDNDDDDGWR